MIEAHIFRLGEYGLICGAKVCDQGRFEPAFIISKCDLARSIATDRSSTKRTVDSRDRH